MVTLIQLALLFSQAPNTRHTMRTHMDHLCLDPGREIFDDHFILVYPWWLQSKAIKTFQGPLKTKILPFIGAFGKNINFLLLLTKFNLILEMQAHTKINLVPK